MAGAKSERGNDCSVDHNGCLFLFLLSLAHEPKRREGVSASNQD